MINFFQAWTLLLMGLKLSGHIDWSWWWVWSPIIFQIFLQSSLAVMMRRAKQKAIEKALKDEKMKAFKK